MAVQYPGGQPGGFSSVPTGGWGGAGGLRVNPSYLPEQWDYKQSPEYQQRLAWAQRDLNRQLLNMGRSDSTGGINAMARQQAEIAGQEIDKQYQRALAANMENYGRYFNANQANYGRTVGEDQTGWDRARYLDETAFNRGNLMGEQDWNRNFQLANMGLGATTTGVQSGNAAGANLATLLSQNGANQASLAVQRGIISADRIQALLNAGWSYFQINEMVKGMGSGSNPNVMYGSSAYNAPLGGAYGTAPSLPAYNAAGIGNPAGGNMYSGGYDFFQQEG